MTEKWTPKKNSGKIFVVAWNSQTIGWAKEGKVVNTGVNNLQLVLIQGSEMIEGHCSAGKVSQTEKAPKLGKGKQPGGKDRGGGGTAWQVQHHCPIGEVHQRAPDLGWRKTGELGEEACHTLGEPTLEYDILHTSKPKKA